MWGKLSRLTGTVLLLAGLLAAPASWAADDVPAADITAIQQVITSQVDAFRHDDGARAFGYATPDLQTMFGDATNFMGLVRRGYQPVYRPKSFSFGTARAEGGNVIQEATMVGPDGLLHTAIYTMEHQPDGSWKIAGCQLIDRPTLQS